MLHSTQYPKSLATLLTGSVLLVFSLFYTHTVSGEEAKTDSENWAGKTSEWEEVVARFQGEVGELYNEYCEKHQQRWSKFQETQRSKFEKTPPRTVSEQRKANKEYHEDLVKFAQSEVKEVQKLQESVREKNSEFYKNLGKEVRAFRAWARKRFGSQDRKAAIEARKVDQSQREEFFGVWVQCLSQEVQKRTPQTGENFSSYRDRVNGEYLSFIKNCDDRYYTFLASSSLAYLRFIASNDAAYWSYIKTSDQAYWNFIRSNTGMYWQFLNANDQAYWNYIRANTLDLSQVVNECNKRYAANLQYWQLAYLASTYGG